MTSSLELHGMYSYDDDVYIRDQLIKHVVITLFVIVIYHVKPRLHHSCMSWPILSAQR
jgi:hypothetical protein